MYGKIFSSMFEGSLYGNPDAIIVMMVLIVLADSEGCVDMTPGAIAARTSFPLETVKRGLAKLSEPDPNSRTDTEDGRRIVLLDDHRDWGWRLVNYAKYREIRTAEERRAYWRKWKRDQRQSTKDQQQANKSTARPQLSTVSTKVEVDAEVDAKAEAYVNRNSKSDTVKRLVEEKTLRFSKRT